MTTILTLCLFAPTVFLLGLGIVAVAVWAWEQVPSDVAVNEDAL
jgi:hypothetical protein